MLDNKFDNWWYDVCKKHKWCDWIDDHIMWYVYTKPREYYRTVRHWFYCNFNKYHWALLKQAWCSYPWDGGFILQLEECQIDKQLHWFEHHQTMVDEQYNEIMRSLRWAKHCIHVMNNECDYFHYDGESKMIPQKYVTNEEGKRVSRYRCCRGQLGSISDGPLNKRNARYNRLSEHFKEGNMDHDYYIAKGVDTSTSS